MWLRIHAGDLPVCWASTWTRVHRWPTEGRLSPRQAALVGDTNWKTPNWCPEYAAAQERFLRELGKP